MFYLTGSGGSYTYTKHANRNKCTSIRGSVGKDLDDAKAWCDAFYECKGISDIKKSQKMYMCVEGVDQLGNGGGYDVYFKGECCHE